MSKVKVSMLLYVHRNEVACLPLLLALYGDGMNTSSLAPHRLLGRAIVQASLSGTPLPNSARTGYVIQVARLISVRLFSAPPPSSPLHPAHPAPSPPSHAVGALREELWKVRVKRMSTRARRLWLCSEAMLIPVIVASKHTHKHRACRPRAKKKKKFHDDSNYFGIICAGVGNCGLIN